MATFSTVADLTITTASITDGQGRKSANVDNSTDLYQRIHWYTRLASGGTGPTAGTLYEMYAFREDNFATEYTTDGTGTTNVPLIATPENAELIGTVVLTNTANKFFYGEGVWEDPGPGGWAMGFMNEGGQTMSTTEADGFIHWIGEKA